MTRLMGYRGKLAEREEARRLRADGWTMPDIAEKLAVSRSSVSLWTRDVPFEPRPRRSGRYGARRRPPNILQRRKQAEIEQLMAEGRQRIGRLTHKEFFVAGVALYAGEGSKTGHCVTFPNSDPSMILFFCSWLRRFFEIDEQRLRLRLYLHDGLDLDAANAFWSTLTGIPVEQFRRPYRATPDPSIRNAKHVLGCPSVTYCSSRTHRAILGCMHALLACRESIPG